LRLLSPKTMIVNIDDNGEVIGYTQVIGNKKIEFKVDEIAHFKWNVLDDDIYGTSAIKPVVEAIRIKLEMEKDLKLISHRYAAPQVHYILGNKDEPASDDDVDDFEKDLQEIHPEMDLVTDHTVSTEVIRPLERDIGVETFLEHIEQQVIAGLQVPEVILGRAKGSTEATANVTLAAFDRRIKSIQEQERRMIESIYDMIVGKNKVQLHFGELEKEDEDLVVNRLLRLKAAGIVTAEYVAKELGIKKKYIPKEPSRENKGNLALKGLDDTKKDVSPHKRPVVGKDSQDVGGEEDRPSNDAG